MAHAEKRVSTARGSKGRVSWRARYKKPDGTWGSEPGFPTKRTAERWGDEQEAAIRAGRWVDPELSRKHFGVWAREWMGAQSPRGRTTMNRWERLDTHILPRWEYTPLQDFNWFAVEAWARTLTCAESTTKDCVGLMSRILTGAVDARHLQVNLLYGRRLTGLSPAVPAEARRDDDEEGAVATPEQVLQVARRLGPVVGLAVVADAFTGMRYEELVGLHRENTLRRRRQRLDGGWFECATIHVHAEVGALAEYYKRDPDTGRRVTYRAFEPPKTPTSVRDIDVPPFLAGLLEAHLDTWPHQHVFTTPRGSLWWRSHWCNTLRPAADGREARPNARGTAVKEAWGPICPGLTARGLRRFHDSTQEQIGVAPVLGYEQMGHRYPGIKAHYRRPTPAMRQHRLDGLQSVFDRAMVNLGWKEIWESPS
ncbi:hypothetical protein [Streptomyces sp. SBT349]|uniref:hypothetical protein n=1 Tax=Streptomyces sp. SBT349 TaxID=1580539 RepID=UPI00066D772C|nr:hypothetical protein [Streptomyces sp. SBT349]